MHIKITKKILPICFLTYLLISVSCATDPLKKGFIDTHVHAFDCRPNGLDIVDEWMKRQNVSHAIIHPLSQSRPKSAEERQEMLKNYKKYEGRILRFCIIYPEDVKNVDEAVKILEQEKKDGAIGFGEHYGVGMMFDDPSNLMFYEACQKVGLPVMFHIDQYRNKDDPGLPRLKRVLELYPKCTLIAHSYFWRQLKNGSVDEVLAKYPNLYADLSPAAVANLSQLPNEKAREFVIKHADKLLFGTDAGWWSFNKIPAPEKEWTYFENLNLPDDVRQKIYRENSIKLFNLK